MMHEHGKSDRRVVPTKPPNKGAGEPPQGPARATPAEAVEGRRLAKSNPHQRTMFRTQRRVAHVTTSWSGYVKQQVEIGRCGSPRSFTMSIALRPYGEPTSA